MKKPLSLLGVLGLFGVLLMGAPSASAAKPVNLPRENHFRCYVVSSQTPQPATTVTLQDQFLGPTTLTVDEPLDFCAPTDKNGEGITDQNEHLTMYGASQELSQHLLVSTRDQFGSHTLEVVGARVLLVPTQKLVGNLRFPRSLNHFWCYEANGPRLRNVTVTLADQFSSDTVQVVQPNLFCNPVEKTIDGNVLGEIFDEEFHLTCYDIKGPQKTQATQFGVSNQFENDVFTITSWDLLCVPTQKLGFQPA
jgi:hypothetical protein